MESGRFFDLFGGIGGFRLGLERASDKFDCTGYIDNDKAAVKSYNEIFGEDNEPRDVREVDGEQLPEFDILCAGFPCPSFSVSGSRQGFEDSRGQLFFEICRVAKEKRPKILFLENVRGILSQDDGKAFGRVLKTLNEIGYYVDFRLLNSKYWGVPQNRERVFILGFDIKWLIKENLQDKERGGQNQKKNLLGKIIKSFLLESLLKNWEEQKRQHEIRLKEWGLNYLLLKELKRMVGEEEIYGQKKRFDFLKKIIPKKLMKRLEPKSEGVQTQLPLKEQDWDSTNTKNQMTKEDTSALTDTLNPMTGEEIDDFIIKWLRKICSEENSKKEKKSTISTLTKRIIEKKTFSSAEIGLIILGYIIKQRTSWENWLKKVSSNLMKIKENINYAKRRETEGVKGSFNLRRDFYSLEVDRREIETGFESFGHLGGEPERTVFPIRREGGEDTGKGRFEPVHTPDFTKKEQNKKSQIGSRDGAMFTIDGTSIHGVYDKESGRIRKLTPKECWRLQGFPDWAYERAEPHNPESQLYKQAGNAVTVPVVEAIGNEIGEKYLSIEK